MIVESKSWSYQLKDSAADSKLKLLKEGETFGVEKPGGEKRLHIGSIKNEKDFDSYFFPNQATNVLFEVSKIDLIHYLLSAQEEYSHPVQSYRLPIKDYYLELLQNTASIEEEQIFIRFVKNVDGKRYYLTRPQGDALSKNYSFISKISLPLVTVFNFLRIKLDDNSYKFFLKPVFDGKLRYTSLPDNKIMNYLQEIYYGAPGTGKSNEIKNLTGENGNDRMFEKDYTIRTTFHPDSDYASFVGAYKPYWDKKEDNGNGKIVYGFRPQSFLKAYIKAWKNPDKNVALVVEEINRGNCAQIFGDIFQLLDREKNGLSKYPIECDVEMQELLAEEFAKESKDFGAAITDDTYADSKEGINNYYSAHYDDAFDKIKSGEILALPMNLSILATMNTSDQSLFPMDSAFKRRWEWIYEPIVEGTNKDTGETLKWKIECGKYKFSADAEEQECVVDWWKFIQKINAVIYSLTSSEDKQLGYFFCQPDKEDGVTISKNLFVGKVIFYLWNEIFKDYAYEHDVCKKENKSDTLYFADFYDGKDNIKQSSLMTFFKHLSEFVDKEVKLIEVKAADTPNENADGGETTQKEQNTEQNEATITENTEA